MLTVISQAIDQPFSTGPLAFGCNFPIKFGLHVVHIGLAQLMPELLDRLAVGEFPASHAQQRPDVVERLVHSRVVVCLQMNSFGFVAN